MLDTDAKMRIYNALEKIFTALRFSAFLALLVMVVISAISMIAQQHGPITSNQPGPEMGNVLNTLSIENEHRFTKLETTVAEIYKQVNDIRTNSWIALFGILGLGGETGVRLGKRLTSRQQQ